MEIGKDVVSRLLESLGYSKQRNQKMEQLGDQHPDRDVQLRRNLLSRACAHGGMMWASGRFRKPAGFI